MSRRKLRLRSELTVRKTGPARMLVGQQDNFYVNVENTGEVPLSNLQIIDSYDPELRPIAANPPEKSIEQGRVVWYLSQLAPGERLTFQVTCQALFDVRSTCSRVIVRAAGGLERTDNHCVRVDPPGTGDNSPDSSTLPPRLLPGRFQQRDDRSPASPLPTAFRPPDETQQGLDLTIDGRGDRWQVGDRIDYLIVIQNAGDQADSDVVLTVQLSPTLQLESYNGPVSAATSSPDWRRLSMIPLRTLRAGETVKFNVIATVSKPGELVARAELTSSQSPENIVRQDVSRAAP